MEKISPLVSIVVPVYNAEQYLKECIDSLLAQTCQDYEVILVDDGSTDQSGNICDAYAENHPSVIVIHQENSGVSAARNAGIARASGIYISFLDCDDYLRDSFVELISDYSQSGTDLLSFQQYYQFDEDGLKIAGKAISYGSIVLKNEQEQFAYLIDNVLRNGWAVWKHVIRREIIEKGSLRFFDYNQVYAEDMCFSCCCCAYVRKVVFIDDPYYFYRIRQSSLSHSNMELNAGRMNEMAKVLENYYQEHSKQYFVENFEIVYYRIMRHIVIRFTAGQNLNVKEFRQMLLNDIPDKDYCVSMVQRILKNKGRFVVLCAVKDPEYEYSFLKFLYDGSIIKSKIRSLIRLIGKKD